MWGGHVVMPAETDSGAFYYHDGEELVYMLSGVLVFELEGTRPTRCSRETPCITPMRSDTAGRTGPARRRNF